MAVGEYGRKPPTFVEASKIASEILNLGEFDSGEIYFNKFRYVCFGAKLVFRRQTLRNGGFHEH